MALDPKIIEMMRKEYILMNLSDRFKVKKRLSAAKDKLTRSMDYLLKKSIKKRVEEIEAEIDKIDLQIYELRKKLDE